MARSARFERATTAFGGRYSIQLSYERPVQGILWSNEPDVYWKTYTNFDNCV